MEIIVIVIAIAIVIVIVIAIAGFAYSCSCFRVCKFVTWVSCIFEVVRFRLRNNTHICLLSSISCHFSASNFLEVFLSNRSGLF